MYTVLAQRTTVSRQETLEQGALVVKHARLNMRSADSWVVSGHLLKFLSFTMTKLTMILLHQSFRPSEYLTALSLVYSFHFPLHKNTGYVMLSRQAYSAFHLHEYPTHLQIHKATVFMH